MEITILTIATILSLAGISGCFLPVIPGPPLSYISIVLVYLFSERGDQITVSWLLTWLAITLAVTILDYIIPGYFTRITGGTRTGEKGAFIGMLAGIFLIPPVGMLGGALLGAFLAEKLIAGQKTLTALKAAAGSFLGFIAGTGLKLTVSIMMLVKLFQIY